MHTPTPPDEVMTLTQAWLEKAVIGLNLCPFAKAVYVNSRFATSSAVRVTPMPYMKSSVQSYSICIRAIRPKSIPPC